MSYEVMTKNFLSNKELADEFNQKFVGSVFYRPLTRFTSKRDACYFVILGIKKNKPMFTIEVFLIGENRKHFYDFTYNTLVLLKDTNTIWWDGQENGEIWATKIS